jgi:hypothetical protein
VTRFLRYKAYCTSNGLSSPKASFNLAWAASSRAGLMTWAVGSPGITRKIKKRMVATANIVIIVYKIRRMIYSCTVILLCERGGGRNVRAASVAGRQSSG